MAEYSSVKATFVMSAETVVMSVLTRWGSEMAMVAVVDYNKHRSFPVALVTISVI